MSDPAPVDVLIVDDSRCDAQLTQLWLKNSPLVRSIEMVHSGKDALARLRLQEPFNGRSLPQVVLLDLHLPDMSGWELFESLQAELQTAHVSVVILTGTLQRSDSHRSSTMGAADCLCKPFDADEFTEFLERMHTVIRGRP